MVDLLAGLIEIANNTLDIVLPWVAIAALIGLNIWFFLDSRKKIKKNKMGISDFAIQFFILILAEAFVIFAVWLLPLLIHIILPWNFLRGLLRWGIFTGIVFLIVRVYGREYGENRWKYSTIGHIIILLLGWTTARWVGIIFLSLPLIAFYYLAVYEHAMVVLPTSIPEDRAERMKRFIILAAYTWGIQFPIMVVAEHAWKKPSVRIPGDFTRDYKVPGLVWTKSHQVAAITGGTQFKRVDGPGLVFTGKLERPLQIVDLRLQLRTKEIDVVSNEGIRFVARVFTAFRMDPESWDKDTYAQLRLANPLMRGASAPSYTRGSFPFSHFRVQAAMGVTSSKAAPGDIFIYWDQWALDVVENEARKILSQKTLDELWRPQDDRNLANALDVIATELKEKVSPQLRAAGILVYAARVVNFKFVTADGQSEDTIPNRQIESWWLDKERKRIQIISEAEAKAEKMRQEARAYAEALFLNSMVQGLQKTQRLHPQLPRYVIAMRFLSSLESYIHNRPDNSDEFFMDDSRVTNLINRFQVRRTQLTSKEGKEETS